MNNSLDFHSMVIISNYFNDIYDFMNVIKTCKIYQDLISTYKHNPISIVVPKMGIRYYQLMKNYEIRAASILFNHIDTLHIDYSLSANELIRISKSYYKIIYWPPIYYYQICDILEYLNNVEFKNVVINKISSNMFEKYDIVNFNKISKLKYDNLNIIELYDYVFKNNTASTIILPNTIRYIGYKCFLNSRAKMIKLPNQLIRIDDCAFEHSFVESIVLPHSVKSLGCGCFKKSKIKSIKLNTLITEIPNNCFEYCDNLNELVLPKNIMKIGKMAFYNCNVQIKMYRINFKHIDIYKSSFPLNIVINDKYWNKFKSLSDDDTIKMSKVQNYLNIEYIDNDIINELNNENELNENENELNENENENENENVNENELNENENELNENENELNVNELNENENELNVNELKINI